MMRQRARHFVPQPSAQHDALLVSLFRVDCPVLVPTPDPLWAQLGMSVNTAIPRKLLGLDAKQPLDIRFKWADNIQKPGDIMDFYLSGDVAPLGRFVWRWRE